MELWKQDLNLGSQGCHKEKVINKTPWIWTRAPLHQMQVFCHWTIKADTEFPHKPVHVKILVEGTNLPNQEKWPARMTVLGSSEWNKIFLNGTNISFLKFICPILNRGVANSFWNHVIQISSRQMYFQDIYSNLWKVKVFIENIYSLKSNTYFLGTVMFVQDGFLYLILTKHKLTVCKGAAWHIIDMVLLYCSPIPARRRGYFTCSNDCYLHAFAAPGGKGGRGQHPVVQSQCLPIPANFLRSSVKWHCKKDRDFPVPSRDVTN